MPDLKALEAGIWSIADGRASEADLALVHEDERATIALLDRMILDTEDDLESVRKLPGDERAQVVADLTETLESLLQTMERFRPGRRAASNRHNGDDEFDELLLRRVRNRRRGAG